jgi:xylulokinase
MKHYLGIDIGTFESKGVVADESGRVVAMAVKPHKMIVPEPGFAEHRPIEDWWDDVTHISRKLLAESGLPASAIKAMGTSAIGPCMLAVDREGEPLMNAVLYGVDARAHREIEELTAAIGTNVLVERCGNALTTQSVGPKILWLKRNRPDIFTRTARIHTSTSFLVERLTGRFVLDHFTAPNFSPLYSADAMSFSEALAPGIMTLESLPEIAWTTDIAGELTKRAAEETGLAEGTPVIVGTIDAAAEAESVGVSEAGDMMIMYGSTVFIILITAERVRDPRLWYAPWLFPGRHASMSGLATSGTLTHWLRSEFARDLDPATAFATLAAEAGQSPAGARGLVVLPYFSGERTPIHDPRAKGVIFGLNLTHKRGDVARALFEGIAYATNHIVETYRQAGQIPRDVFSVGGGTKNPVWLQATSDVSGVTQILREKTFGASFGDAFLAALAVGDVKPEAITSWNPRTAQITANAAVRAVYDRQFAVFKELYPRTKSLMATLDA